MNRRKLLKSAGVASLVAPFITAGVVLQRSKAQTASTIPLMIVFSGPFVLWMNADGNPNLIRVVAPPVGPQYPDAPHWPWAGTTANETALNNLINPSLKLTMVFTPTSQLEAGVEILSCPRPSPLPQPGPDSPLFTLDVPNPDVIVGTNPTEICLDTCAADGSNRLDRAAGAVFLYRQVDLNSVQLSLDNGPYIPDFHIDVAAFPAATLGIHLSPCDCAVDWCHTHARAVVSRMQGLYSWIPNIDFFPPTQGCPTIAQGDDCQAPMIRV